MSRKALIGSALVALSLSSVAQDCKDDTLATHTPIENFVDNKDGTVTDARTGLMWTKCSLGQEYVYEDGTCVGAPQKYSWQNALKQITHINADTDKGAYYLNDWRLPNIKELGSLLERKCYNPMINLEVFPNTPSSPYHSSTPDPFFGGVTSDAMKYVNFLDGLESDSAQSALRLVRMVRYAN